jgi:hypothetical protein
MEFFCGNIPHCNDVQVLVSRKRLVTIRYHVYYIKFYWVWHNVRNTA